MSIEYPNIMTECNVDTNVVSYLMHGAVNHQSTCNDVAKTIQLKFRDRFAIGIIDDDKRGVAYLNECETITSSKHLRVFKHHELHHYMITVGPAMDGFLWDCAKEQKANPNKYNLPTEWDAFKARMKKKTSNADPDIRALVKAISGNLELVAFQKLLLYLKDNTYQSKRDDIVRIFE